MRLTDSRNCYCGAGAIRHDYGKGKHCQKPEETTSEPPHERYADAFEDAHMAAAGAVMGARMAGKDIAPWSADMNEAFRAAVAEAFDAGFRARQGATR